MVITFLRKSNGCFYTEQVVKVFMYQVSSTSFTLSSRWPYICILYSRGHKIFLLQICAHSKHLGCILIKEINMLLFVSNYWINFYFHLFGRTP